MTILGALIILIFFTPEPRGWGEEGEEGVDEGVGVKCKILRGILEKISWSGTRAVRKSNEDRAERHGKGEEDILRKNT